MAPTTKRTHVVYSRSHMFVFNFPAFTGLCCSSQVSRSLWPVLAFDLPVAYINFFNTFPSSSALNHSSLPIVPLPAPPSLSPCHPLMLLSQPLPVSPWGREAASRKKFVYPIRVWPLRGAIKAASGGGTDHYHCLHGHLPLMGETAPLTPAQLLH